MSANKVLIADDSPLVVRMIEKMLAGAGFGVVTAGDGLDAVQKAVSEDVSLIILDVMMPRMNGYQACRILKNEPATKAIPVVILTSRDQAGDRFWGFETGADYYITKDSDPHRIVELVRRIFADGIAVRPKASEGARTGLDIMSRVNDLLDRKLYEATILSEIGRVARSLVKFDETFTSVMSIVGRVVDFTVGAVAFVDDEEADLLVAMHRPASADVVEEAKSRIVAAAVQERGGTGFTRVQARLFPPPAGAPTGPEEAALGGFAAYPIVTNGRLSGMLAVAGKAANRINADTQAFMAQVANQAHIVMDNSRLFDRVQNLSIRDSLTNLYNHRHSMTLLATEFERVGRYREGLCLAMIDIDHFKQVNDTHGHPVGDVVIREISRLLQDTVRSVDMVGRYGGEEFMAVLPHTEYEEGLATAERLRVAIEKQSIKAGSKSLQVTVSVGVGCYPNPDIDTPADLIRVADQALYRAKQAGRNRVC